MAALGLTARTPRAAPPEHLELEGKGSCPSAADVARELQPLLPHTRIVVEPGAKKLVAAARATIVDDGEAMRVEIGGERRVFRDPDRACSERARSSAVFIGLVLDPPLLPEAERPASPPRDVPAAPTSSAPPAGPHLTVELGPRLEVAPISDAAALPLAGGFGGRLAWGRGLALSLGAAFLLPTRLELPEADARLVWLPFDVSLRASQHAGPVQLAAELGPELALLFASGDRVQNPRTSTRLEIGVRTAGSLTWGMSQHLGAFVTLFGVWRPKPYEFRVNPDLASGTTPPLWLGSSLGLSLRTR
jgi:hypothetical protein